MDEKRLKEIAEICQDWPGGCPVELDEVFAEVRRLRAAVRATSLYFDALGAWTERLPLPGDVAGIKAGSEPQLDLLLDEAIDAIRALPMSVITGIGADPITAAAIRRAERERCAKVADAYAKRAWAAEHVSEPAAVAAEHVAEVIRALPDDG